MKKYKILILLIVIIQIVACSSNRNVKKNNEKMKTIEYQPVYQEKKIKNKSLFADHKSYSRGDIITILISEEATAESSAKSSTNRSFNHGFSTEAGQGPMSFIPLAGMGAGASNTSGNDAKTSRTGSFETKITARIISIDQNGNLKIKGEKYVLINGEKEQTTIEGLVRPQDISSDNKVQSYNIANAKISYNGKGSVNDGGTVGFITRIFNFLF